MGSRALALAAALTVLSGLPVGGETLQGVVALGSPDNPPPTAVYAVPAVRGVSLTAAWSTVNPAKDTYDWSSLDAAVAQVPPGIRIAIGVAPGVNAPAWVYDHWEPAMPVTWELPWAPIGALGVQPCASLPFPQPWGSDYISKWSRLIGAMGQHYRHNRQIVAVKASGISVTTLEVLLPYQQSPENDGECGGEPPVSLGEWQAAGYLPQAIEQAMQHFAHRYEVAFDWRQQIIWQAGGWPFPPIDDTGAIDGTADTTLMSILLVDAQQEETDRFLIDSGTYKSTSHWTPPGVLGSVQIGAQEEAPITGDPTCRANNFVTPCDPATVMQGIVSQAQQAGAAFLEVYPSDLLNPALLPALQSFQAP